MAKKEFNSFQEEVEYDYHRKKKVEQAKARLKLIELGVILIGCIVLLIICATHCTNGADIISNIDAVNTLG